MSQAVPSLYDSFALYGSGVTLISAREGDEDRFLVAASVLTASVAPFTIAASVGRHRAALPAITSGSPWAVSVLAAHHAPLVRRLTGPTTADERRESLEVAGAQTSPEGPLWLPDALVTLWCTLRSTTPVHDQLLVVGQVERGSAHEGGPPLLRWNRDFCTASRLQPPPVSGAAAA